MPLAFSRGRIEAVVEQEVVVKQEAEAQQEVEVQQEAERTGTITLPSIDLAAIRGPLNKNKNAPQLFYESPTPSLPSVSSLRGGGAGSSQCDADEGSPIAGRRDFRGTLGDDWHPIHYEGQFIRSWRSEFEDIKFPTVKFNTTDHHHRDINPSDGTFLPPVEYGDCFPSNEPASVEFPQGTEEYPAWVPEADAPTESIQEKEEEEQQPQIISQPVPDYDLSAPRIPCYIRPAQISDMVQVVAIYNHEVENGLQAPDSKPLSLDDFKRIFTVETVSAGLPFLVAVYGSVKGFKTTTGKVHISPSTRRPPEATAWPNTSMVGRIAGFAYLSPWSLGLGGRPSEASRASVKVNLYVSPDFRRKRVGSALLDRLLSMHSTRFETRDNYDYIDAIKNPIYGSPEVNARKTWRMFLSYNVLHATGNQFSAEVRKATEENEKDLKSIEVVLEDSFYFDKIARYNMALRTPKKGAETVSWMDVVVYEHTCHNGGDFKDVVNY
ncbi:hypothetical protein QBC47DRAFT_412836 [Echria macrotheca]|uniref:Uncharacterized protein n=1 Tax=Echria macrotheca TaxID=438768 RepID=A0AAJ0BDF3_9PEZI|nr:hypothetical protein QBC47DRAFT_412836 [Echria macrotheca]